MDASFEPHGERYRLTFERKLKHPPEKVWRVLTERELLRQWFPADIEGEWSVGAPLRFTFVDVPGEGVTDEDMRGEVLAVDPPRLLEFRWGQHVLRAELVADGDGCTLTFSETIGDPSWAARDAAGWEMCFENLEAILQGAAAVEFAWKAWLPKFRRYVAQFEPRFGKQAEPPEGIHEAEA